jgi:hypothetical protein
VCERRDGADPGSPAAHGADRRDAGGLSEDAHIRLISDGDVGGAIEIAKPGAAWTMIGIGGLCGCLE